MTPEMTVAVQYQSHLPALLACIAVTDGPVLELGVGHFSTPHLHALCGAMGRLLGSWEDNREWFEEFRLKYESKKHWFQCGSYLEAVKVGPDNRGRFGVAFIDNSPGGEGRSVPFRALIEISEFVVVHDAQKDAENFQAVEMMLEGLHWHLCTGYFPHTLVASKTRQIPEVLLGM
jgi:hypothetical protein